MRRDKAPVRANRIDQKILVVRGCRVILDTDLAELYGVSTKALNQAVKRNRERFPPDFCFPLTKREKQEVVTICDHLEKLKFSPGLPYAFTEHGAIMAATLLKSERAVAVSVFVVRAFIRFHEMLTKDKALAKRFAGIEKKIQNQDGVIRSLVVNIQRLREIPKVEMRKNRPIGFSLESPSHQTPTTTAPPAKKARIGGHKL